MLYLWFCSFVRDERQFQIYNKGRRCPANKALERTARALRIEHSASLHCSKLRRPELSLNLAFAISVVSGYLYLLREVGPPFRLRVLALLFLCPAFAGFERDKKLHLAAI
jgi:hypothetical protein